MEVAKEFSKFAHEYGNHNLIQKEVAQKLCSFLDKKRYKRILDVGAGDGEIYENLLEHNIECLNFVALDFSKEMLALHRDAEAIQKVCLDFNQKGFSSVFQEHQLDLIIASSSLQWSDDLSNVLAELSSLSDTFLFSFFTANTFKSLHQTVNIKSPILTQREILEALNKYFIYDLELIEYKLEFSSVYEMLHYIKKSGVGGGVKQLGYGQMKKLLVEYPLNYLEFEVVFVKVIKKKKGNL